MYVFFCGGPSSWWRFSSIRFFHCYFILSNASVYQSLFLRNELEKETELEGGLFSANFSYDSVWWLVQLRHGVRRPFNIGGDILNTSTCNLPPWLALSTTVVWIMENNCCCAISISCLIALWVVSLNLIPMLLLVYYYVIWMKNISMQTKVGIW